MPVCFLIHQFGTQMIAHLHRSESEFISEDDFFFLCAAAPLRD
jgi:hypothetical protein